MDALQLLDYGGWRCVFRKLEAEDLVSCQEVCKPFQQILDEREFAMKWRFNAALPLLFEYLKSWDTANYWEKLLKLRLASQSWRHSVDKYVSEIYEPDLSSNNVMYSFPLVTRLISSEEIDEFHEKFGNYEGNPFPSKTVLIWNMYGVGLQPAYITRIKDFAHSFGRHIRKLELDLILSYYDCHRDSVNLCELIKTITMHLPNLVTFSVASIYEPTEEEEGVVRNVRDDPQQLANWIGENPLSSDLPKLKALKIVHANATIVNYLVESYAEQLTAFVRSYDIQSYYPPTPIQLNAQRFRNLRKMSLELVDPADTLETLRGLESPVKIMKVFLCCRRWGINPPPMVWNVDKALRNLRHLPLESLEIGIYEDMMCVVEEGLELDEYVNESIQSLNVHFISDGEGFVVNDDGQVVMGGATRQISFNFLESLKKLEELMITRERVTIQLTQPEEKPEVVKLNEYLIGGETTPYQSNVWEKVPSLKTLIDKRSPVPFRPNEYDKSTYTREGYEMVRRE